LQESNTNLPGNSNECNNSKSELQNLKLDIEELKTENEILKNENTNMLKMLNKRDHSDVKVLKQEFKYKNKTESLREKDSKD